MELIEAIITNAPRLDMLRAQRAKVAESLQASHSARDIAALSRELRAIDEAIVALAPDKTVGDPVDEIAARRTHRRTGAPTRSRRAEG